ncbi:phytoene desaturase family protein [soil metagenome]
MADVLVVGAGVGGLAAAVVLAARGLNVEVLEAADRPGGKLGIGIVDGTEFDTGPSVLTLPVVLDRIFRLVGTSLEDELELRAAAPAFRYLYPDGVALDIYPDLPRTLGSVEQTLGGAAAREMEAFLAYGRRIWEAAAPHFVFGPAPSPASLMQVGLSGIKLLGRIDPLRGMWSVIRRRVRSQHLRMLFARYATYNGSDPRTAPATLNCIAHVELALGGYGVKGGMYEITRALVRVAERLGVRLHYGARVTRITVEGGGVAAVETADGARWRTGAVIANADVAQVFGELIPGTERGAAAAAGAPSMSGWTGILRARRREGPQARVAHTVLFPTDYLEEFRDIFDRNRPPREPTVYLCAQEVCHGRSGWAEHEPIFLMANAPAEPGSDATPEHVWDAFRAGVLDRLHGVGLCAADDLLVWERTPTQLARQFPGSRGSIYGAASNSPLAAFRRPANRVRGVGGLYLASGSAHPGGGMPLCLLSGCAAAQALLSDRGMQPLETEWE